MPATGAGCSATRTWRPASWRCCCSLASSPSAAGAWLSGGADRLAWSSLFLVYSAGKSSLTLCFAVLLLTSLTAVVRSFWARALMLLLPLLLLNLLSIGTVMFERLAEIASLLPLDSTFTGRTDIWSFALQSLQPRLATGYGFAAFWGSSAIQNLPEGKEWAGFASHSHNGYLDTALGMGLPGLALLFVLLVIEPLRNFQARRSGRQQRPAGDGAVAHLAVRAFICRRWRASSSTAPIRLWFTFLLAVFGLHYLARFRRGRLEATVAAPRTALRRHPATSHRNRTAPAPAAVSAPRRSGRHRPRPPIRARPARWRRGRSTP